MNKIQKKFLIVFLSIFGILAVNFTTLAVAWPSVPVTGTQLHSSFSKLSDLIKYIYEWSIVLGGLSVFVVLIIAGIQYLTSAGNPGQIAIAKKKINSAILGLILLLSSYLILNIINPIFVDIEPIDFSNIDSFKKCSEGDSVETSEGIEFLEGDEYCHYFFGNNYSCKSGSCVVSLKHLWTKNDCKELNITIIKSTSGNLYSKLLAINKKPYEIAKEFGTTLEEDDKIIYKIPENSSQKNCFAKLTFCNNKKCTDPLDSLILVPPDLDIVENFTFPLDEAGENYLSIEYIKLEPIY